jgi:hypothetical protein
MNIHTIILVSCFTNVVKCFVINSGRYHGLPCDTGFHRQEHFKPFLMTNSPSSEADEVSFRAEAERLRRQAKEIRDSLSKSTNTSVEVGGNRMLSATESLFRIPVKNADLGVEYRLDFDIGREAGTWMDPRWGASGKRIPWTLDVLFTSIQLSPEDERYKRIKLVYKNDAIVRSLETASAGRLRQGFDSMPVYPGAYYVDVSDKGQTCRFVIPVDGTPERGGSYGYVLNPVVEHAKKRS